jgi:hypothetical protein
VTLHEFPSVADRLRRGRELVDASAERAESAAPLGSSRDLFAGAGLPKVAHDDLTADRVASGLLHHGAIFVRGLLPAEKVHQLRAFIDLGEMRIVPGAQATADQARMLDALVESYEVSGTLAVVESYLGEAPVGMIQRTLVKRNEQGHGLNWHQDACFFGGKCVALSVWTALTACGDDCPGISVIPRRLETIFDPDHQLPGSSKPSVAAAEELAREVGTASPAFEAGDAIIFDEMTLHRTSARPWNVLSRDVAITWFFAPSRYPGNSVPLAL